MSSETDFDNYIAEVTNYLAGRISADLGTPLADSLDFLLGTEFYLALTDRTCSCHQLPLEEMVIAAESEYRL